MEATTYRERRARKAERLRGWADKREARSETAFGRVEQITSMIPMGQPILVGHHSEHRARRDQERIVNGMTASLEHRAKAEDFRRRADGIERAAEHAIYSDDDDAVERLTARLAELEAERERIKAYNASCRKGAPVLEVLTERERADLASVARYAPYSLGKGGAFPGYKLTNLGGNIARQRKRLSEMTREGDR